MVKKPIPLPAGCKPSDPPADHLNYCEAIDPLFQDSVVEPAQEGEAATLDRPEEALNATPADFQQAGNLGLLAAAAQIGLIAGNNVALCESLWRQMAEVKAKLAGSNAGPLESLLIDQIGICWLHAYAADLMLAQRLDVSLRQAKFLEKRRDQAHRRFTTAMKGLASVRKLLGTGSSVNKPASKQV